MIDLAFFGSFRCGHILFNLIDYGFQFGKHLGDIGFPALDLDLAKKDSHMHTKRYFNMRLLDILPYSILNQTGEIWKVQNSQVIWRIKKCSEGCFR